MVSFDSGGQSSIDIVLNMIANTKGINLMMNDLKTMQRTVQDFNKLTPQAQQEFFAPGQIETIRGMEKQLQGVKMATEDMSQSFDMTALGIMFAGMQLMATFGGVFRMLASGYSEAQSANSKYNEQMSELNARFEYFKFLLFDAFANSSLFTAFIGILNNIIDWFIKLPDGWKEFIVWTIAAIAAVGGLLFLFGSTSLAIKALGANATTQAFMTFLKSATGAATGLGAAMTSVFALAALIIFAKALSRVYAEWDGLTYGLQTVLWATFTEAGNMMWRLIADIARGIQGLIDGLGPFAFLIPGLNVAKATKSFGKMADHADSMVASNRNYLSQMSDINKEFLRMAQVQFAAGSDFDGVLKVLQGAAKIQGLDGNPFLDLRAVARRAMTADDTSSLLADLEELRASQQQKQTGGNFIVENINVNASSDRAADELLAVVDDYQRRAETRFHVGSTIGDR